MRLESPIHQSVSSSPFCTVEVETGVFDQRLERLPEAQDLLPGSGSWFCRLLKETNRYFAAQHAVTDYPEGPWSSIEKWMNACKTLEGLRTNNQFVPIGWPGDEHVLIQNRDEVGRLMGLNAIDVANALRPTLLKGGVSEVKADYWIRENAADMVGPRLKSYLKFHYFTARAKLAVVTM